MFVIVTGHSTAAAEGLRERLASLGVDCKSSSTMPVENVLHVIGTAETPPDLIVFQCAGELEADCLEIQRLRLAISSDIAAVGVFSHPRDMLELVRAGANDCLESGPEFGQDVNRLMLRLRQRTRRGSRGRIISVLAASGGCGASSVAINLAAALKQQGGTPSVIELQYDGGVLEAMLDMKTDHTLSDLVEESIDFDQEMLAKTLVEHSSGMRLLASPPAREQSRPLTPEGIERVLNLAANMSSHVILDLQDSFHADQVAALLASDLIFLVLRVDFPCLLRTQRTVALLNQHGIPSDRIQLVANRQVRRCGLNSSQVIAALGQPIAHKLPDDFTASVTSMNVGSPVVLESPSSLLARAYRAMAQPLLSA